MAPNIARVVLLLVVAADWTAPSSALAQAGGNCSQVVSQIARQHAAFQKEAEKQGLDYLSDEAFSHATGAVEPLLEGAPMLAHAAEVKGYKEAFENWDETCKRHQVTFQDIIDCNNNKPKGCNLQELVKRQSRAFRDWFTASASDGIPAAMERVRKASALLKNYTARLGSSAEGSMSAAVECLNSYQERAQQLADPVDAGTPPAGSNPDAPAAPPASEPVPKTGGYSAGTRAVIALAAAGVGVGAAVYAGKLTEDGGEVTPSCSSQESAVMSALVNVQNQVNYLGACGSSQSCYNSRWSAFTSAYSGFASSLSTLCSCMGYSGNSMSASEKAAIQQAWAAAPALGFNPGTLPSCFR